MSLIIPDFDKLNPSTQTVIAVANLNINTEKLFEYLPITKYIVIPKKRGRKKKELIIDPNVGIKDGSIITLQMQDKIRGVELKKKNKNSNKRKYFRNALTIVMIIEGKMINFKISKNGKFQITGCKHVDQAKQCIKYTWDYIFSNKEIYNFRGVEHLRVIFLVVMTNIDFNIGFYINRENLDNYINKNTEYNSLLETSFGYTGVNIKVPMTEDIFIDLNVLEYIEEKWKMSNISYQDYILSLDPKEQAKEKKKKRYNTFLVFHSGNVIMSGMIKKYMEKTFYNFMKTIKNCEKIIKEKLST